MNQIFDDDSALNERNETGVFCKKCYSSKNYQRISCQEYRTQVNTRLFCPRNTYSLLVCLHSGSILFTSKTSKTLQKKGIEHISLHTY